MSLSCEKCSGQGHFSQKCTRSAYIYKKYIGMREDSDEILAGNYAKKGDFGIDLFKKVSYNANNYSIWHYTLIDLMH